MAYKKCVALFFVVSLFCCPQQTEAKHFVDKLMKKMTLREKIGQMSQFVTKTSTVTGPGGERMDISSLIKAGEVESKINTFENSLEVIKLMDEARKQIGVKYPADETK